MNPALHARLTLIKQFSIKIVQLGCFAHLANEYVFEIRPCSGPSMYPTLAIQGDYLFCVRTPFLKTFLSRRAPHVDRGDLIDYISPTDPTYSVCKRVIGIEGDVVCVDSSGEKGRKEDWVKVPIGYVWATGDNLSNSTDSRDYGPVPIGLIRGKILARIWPNPRWLSATRDGTTVVAAPAPAADLTP